MSRIPLAAAAGAGLHHHRIAVREVQTALGQPSISRDKAGTTLTPAAASPVLDSILCYRGNRVLPAGHVERRTLGGNASKRKLVRSDGKP
jgi:hypothetical protein